MVLMRIVGREGDGGHNESGNLRIACRYQADLEIKSMATRNPLRQRQPSTMGDVGCRRQCSFQVANRNPEKLCARSEGPF